MYDINILVYFLKDIVRTMTALDQTCKTNKIKNKHRKKQN